MCKILEVNMENVDYKGKSGNWIKEYYGDVVYNSVTDAIVDNRVKRAQEESNATKAILQKLVQSDANVLSSLSGEDKKMVEKLLNEREVTQTPIAPKKKASGRHKKSPNVESSSSESSPTSSPERKSRKKTMNWKKAANGNDNTSARSGVTSSMAIVIE
jgi:hypothetical protein